MPVLPGALLLDEVLHLVQLELALDLVEWQVAAAKFLEPVRPGDVLTMEHTAASDTVRFAVRVADRLALTGSLARLRPAAPDGA